MFEPRLALASLSGESDAAWARAGAPYAGAAFLGGLSLDEATREAARTMVAERDREEFLPDDPYAFMRDQLDAVAEAPIRPGFNVRALGPGAIRTAARICAERGALLEVNAHCRQEEMCSAGAGETLLGHPERLAAQVSAAHDEGATVSVKVRAGVPDVDLPALAARLDEAGLDAIHVDAMDSEAVVAEIVRASDAFVVANNGVRDERTTREYLAYGADAVSVGRPSDDPAILSRVSETVREWFA
ncbi:MAG: tRNA-dihydrouridine synthase [Halanaeroarchaeum sp.]